MTTQSAQQSDEERTRAAEEQNKRAQEEARRQIKEAEEKQLQKQRDAIGQTATTAPTTFQEAAKATEELEQPPNFSNAQELEQPAQIEQAPAKNVNEETLPEEIRAENIEANEATVASPSSTAPPPEGATESMPTSDTTSTETTTTPPPSSPTSSTP